MLNNRLEGHNPQSITEGQTLGSFIAVPDRVLDALRANELSFNDVLLVSLVCNYTQCHGQLIGDRPTRWCFASNKYLGQYFGVSEKSMANKIEYLVNRNILVRGPITTERGGRKRRRLCWAGDHEAILKAEAKYGK